MNWIINLFFFIFSFNAFAISQEDLKKYDELEGLAYIETLYSDKKYDLVISEYNKVTLTKNDLDRASFILASSYYIKNDYNKSMNTLNKISQLYVSNFKNDVHLLAAKNYLAFKDYFQCSQKLNNVELTFLKKDDWKLFTKCYLESDKKFLLNKFLSLDFNDEEYQLQAQWVLIKHGLQVFAKEKRTNFLEKCRSEVFYLDLIKILSDSKIEDPNTLEMAHACLPQSTEVTGHLVKILFKKEQFHSVAYLFENMASINLDFNKHTAEFYKVAGRKSTAQYFYSGTTNQQFSLSQLENFVNSEKFSGVLTYPLADIDLTKSKDLNYALQYALFKFGLNNEALKSLNLEKNKSDKQKNLIALAQKCFELGWKCRP